MGGVLDPDEEFKRAGLRVDGEQANERAGRVLATYGDSLRGATNPPSGSNDVWVTERLVLRISRSLSAQPSSAVHPQGLDDESLVREAALARLLPAEIGYPNVVATGSEDGYSWILCERLPGENLWDAWPILSSAERLGAVAELWRRVCLVRSVSVEAAAAIGLGAPRRYPFERPEFSRRLARLAKSEVLDASVVAAAEEVVERARPHIGGAPTAVLHGDIGLTNALCSEGQLVALLDFEAAAIGPADLDLEYLLRLLSDPLDDPGDPGPHGLPSPESFEGVWDTVVDAARPLLEAPGAQERLTAYAVLFDVTILDRQLDRGWPPARVRGSSERLVAVATTGGYLRRIWA